MEFLIIIPSLSKTYRLSYAIFFQAIFYRFQKKPQPNQNYKLHIANTDSPRVKTGHLMNIWTYKRYTQTHFSTPAVIHLYAWPWEYYNTPPTYFAPPPPAYPALLGPHRKRILVNLLSSTYFCPLQVTFRSLYASATGQEGAKHSKESKTGKISSPQFCHMA